jgi:N-acetylglucosaminyl-diphospho-decaprenol L-rhamnosyltransferase
MRCRCIVAAVDVVVVNHNTCAHLDACLSALRDARVTRVVVDNASIDDSAAMVRERHPGVVLIDNTHNLGYGAAANQGIARCVSEYVLLLNSDTVIAPGALDALSAYLDQHPGVAIAGPRITYPDGHLQSSCNPFPTLLPTLLAESATGQLLSYVPLVREFYLPSSSHTRARAVPWIMGSAMAIRRTAFDAVGGFDTAFFMYFEEVDLCYRLWAAGWRVHFAPVATVVHVGAASTRRRRSDMAVQALSSRLLFYRRHYPDLAVGALVLLIDAVVFVRWILGPLRIRLARDHARRAQLRDEMFAWRRVLRGEWLRPVLVRPG